MLEGTISLQQAMVCLSRSDQQVRRYIRKKRLPAQKVGGQYFIKQTDVDALAYELARPPDVEQSRRHTRDVDARLDALTSDMSEILRSLARIEQAINDMRTQNAEQPTAPTEVVHSPGDTNIGLNYSIPQKRTSASNSGIPALPVGYRSLREFATSHNVPITSAAHLVDVGTLEATIGKWMNPPATRPVERAFSPDQQRVFLVVVKERYTLTRCQVQGCPCQREEVK